MSSSPIASPVDHAAGAPVGGASRVEALADRYAGLAGDVTLRYLHQGVDLDELRAASRRGLQAAAATYDPDTGVDFVTHALPQVRAAVKATFRAAGGRIGQPRRHPAAPVVHHAEPSYAAGWDTDADADDLRPLDDPSSAPGPGSPRAGPGADPGLSP